MKIEEVPHKLYESDYISINNGEIQIKKKLKAYIGEVPMYKLMITFPKDKLEPLYFDNIHEMDEWSSEGLDHKRNLRRCCICGDIPITEEQEQAGKEAGYWVDNELHQYYCCYEHLAEWMNDVFGEGEWKRAEEPFMGVEIYVKDLDNGWKPYDCHFVSGWNECELIAWSD